MMRIDALIEETRLHPVLDRINALITAVEMRGSEVMGLVIGQQERIALRGAPEAVVWDGTRLVSVFGCPVLTTEREHDLRVVWEDPVLWCERERRRPPDERDR